MKRRVLLDPDAIEDVQAIHGSLSRRFGRTTADRSVSSLLLHLGSFELFPERGRRFDVLRPDLRIVGYRRLATIAFRVEPDRVTIVRVFAAGRNIHPDDVG